MPCSTPGTMYGPISRAAGASPAQGAEPSTVKNTAPVRRTTRSTSERVSPLTGETPDDRSCGTDAWSFSNRAIALTTTITAPHTSPRTPLRRGSKMAQSLEVTVSDPKPVTPDLVAVKARQQAMWASGDFAVVGTTLQIVGESLCEAVDVEAGSRVLDVACGNGNATLAAARRFAKATGIDYVPEL